nr:glycosyltransferase [Lacticaseibacillus parakribbianus]
MHAANIIGLFRNIYWSVSSPVEKADLLTRVKTDESHVFEAGDIPAAVTGTCPDKIKGNALRVVWFSRVSREKNLLGSIEILSRTKKRIHFNIIGPIEDEEYWRLCQSKLADLRSNVSWSYEGPVLPEDVADRLRKQDVFLFPTLGENYGHVIHEALAAGCPCLISDKTPWRDLEAWHAGFTIGLQDYATYAKRLDWFADMKPSQFKIYVRGAFDFVSQDTQVESRKDAYRVLLTEVSSRGLKMKKSVKG